LLTPGFQAEWEELRAACPWSTVFQSAAFVLPWLRCYEGVFAPVLVLGRDAASRLAGMLHLAVFSTSGELVFCGAQHCEYKVWLARPEANALFLEGALRALRRAFPRGRLRMDFLPPGAPVEWWQQHPRWSRQSSMRPIERHSLCLTGFEVARSPAYRKFKQRLNKLGRLGEVTLERWTHPSQMEAEMERLATLCDFRHAAQYGVRPFHDDARKAPLHLELMAVPGLLHATVLRLNGGIISVEVNTIDGSRIIHGLLGHSPFFSQYSPGRYHLLRLCALSAQEGFSRLDLTPGGEYKSDFATCSEVAYIFQVFLSSIDSLKFKLGRAAQTLGKWLLKRVCKTPEDARRAAARWAHRWRLLRVGRIPGALARMLLARLWETRELRVYRFPAEAARQLSYVPRLARNELRDLLAYAPVEAWQPTYREFLSSALERIEAGESVYTVAENGRLVHYGWVHQRRSTHLPEVSQRLELPEGSAVLYDFYTHPACRGRGFYQAALRQILAETAGAPQVRQLYIAVLANNRASRHSIEKVGFIHEKSLFRRARLFVSRSWS
jgi:CelD/BcsL family acetyltransferase involved in cellulose biosynthesis/RimJ/RimL family protein N-acetyltransferase